MINPHDISEKKIDKNFGVIVKLILKKENIMMPLNSSCSKARLGSGTSFDKKCKSKAKVKIWTKLNTNFNPSTHIY